MSEDTNNPYGHRGDHRPLPNEHRDTEFTPNPTVIPYQRIYVLLMFLLYAALVVGVVVAAVYRESVSLELEMSSNELLIMLAVYGVPSAALAIIFFVRLFWNRGLGGWIYNLILIVLGMTSCCTWPITIPLMIFWIKQKDDIQYS